jgi:hypothetical protein
MSDAQNDACKTINPGRKASCQHTGAGCDSGTGPGTGRCTFQSDDGRCECVGKAIPPPPTITGVVGNTLSSPVFVNLYWDATWDADNPTMTKQELDGFTVALLNSSYFGHLAEYGVGSPSFAGGFLPAPLCTQKAPPSVGFYDPVNASIIGFLQCELDHGNVPQGSQVVYNVILPSGSLESDFFGLDKFCAGGPASAWHFHQTPYSPQAVIGIGAALLGAATGGVQGALIALLGALGALQGGPLYTIESADSRCVPPFMHNLLHEMVEATSDPFPPPSVLLSGGGGEIVDICDLKGVLPSRPFVPPVPVLANLGFPASSSFTDALTGPIIVPQYWSNAGQQCFTGFTNNKTPSGAPGPVSPLKITTSGNGAASSFTITGIGFGTLPPPQTAPTSAALPYIAIQDTTQRWQIGNSLNSDTVTLNTASWSDTSIAINGFAFNSGNLIMKPQDNLTVWVCNPASGDCGSGSIPLTESGAPQLKVIIANASGVTLSYDISIDGTQVAGPLTDGGTTGWLPLASGNHTVTEKQTTPGLITSRFTGACNATGQVTLNPGDNTICTIVNIASAGCPNGQHCCSTPTTSSGCPSGCVPNTTVCQPLCPAGTNKCCGSALPNGKCSDACIKSPPASCP